jgi:hypothetical protein
VSVQFGLSARPNRKVENLPPQSPQPITIEFPGNFALVQNYGTPPHRHWVDVQIAYTEEPKTAQMIPVHPNSTSHNYHRFNSFR